MDILDTNVILRFLVGDEPEHQKSAKLWFGEAEKGRRRILILPLVVAEAVFVLESFYKKSRAEICEAMEVFLSQRWLIVEEREALLGTFKFYKQGLHFVDSHLLALARTRGGKVLTFDIKLKKKQV